MADKTRYQFLVRDRSYDETDPRHWEPACSPRMCQTDAEAEQHVRWMSLGKMVLIKRSDASWWHNSPAGR